jgi:hypothetical protein
MSPNEADGLLRRIFLPTPFLLSMAGATKEVEGASEESLLDSLEDSLEDSFDDSLDSFKEAFDGFEGVSVGATGAAVALDSSNCRCDHELVLVITFLLPDLEGDDPERGDSLPEAGATRGGS